MPQLRPVPSLRQEGVSRLANFLHETFKRKTCRKARRYHTAEAKSLEVFKLRFHAVEMLKVMPATLQEEIFNEMKDKLMSENSFLEEHYFKCLSSFWNEKTRNITLLNPRLFQDSSLAFEAFMSGFKSCNALKELNLARPVIDLADFNFSPVLAKIASAKNLEKLTIQGLNEVEISEDDMESFLRTLAQNCDKLQYLDLCDSTLSDACCEVLGEIASLKILKLNHCTMETSGAAEIMTNLRNLVQFECDNHLQNIVAKELLCDGVAHSMPLQFVTFRDLYSIREVGQTWPNIENVRLVYNEFESDIKLEDGLRDLMEFPNARKLRLELEMNGANLLLPIQMKFLETCGHIITKLTLNHCEFLHPQTLNPWSFSCQNITHLSIYGCHTVSDEMFVGDVPELERYPFRNLRELNFEGSLTPQLASYLLTGRLSKVRLYVKGIFPSESLEYLLKGTKWNLEELRISVERIRVEFPEILRKLLEEAPALNRLELLCNSDSDLADDLEDMSEIIRRNNWNVTFLYHIKQRRIRP